mgnify:FL=1
MRWVNFFLQKDKVKVDQIQITLKIIQLDNGIMLLFRCDGTV